MDNTKKIKATTTYYNTVYQYSSIQKPEDGEKMRGTRRVLTFCLLTTVLPFILIIIPLYLRNIKYADVMYKVSQSDIIQIHQGQSPIFCERHSLQMNTTFNAFQMKGWPDVSDKRKHIQLKKSMILPDDTLEYWGFFLLKGATVELKACSRYEGSKILVVKGDKILNTCDILDDKLKKETPLNVVNNQGHVVITIESPTGHNNSQSRNEKTNIIDDNNAEENITDDLYDGELLMLKKTLQSKIKHLSNNNNNTDDFKDSMIELTEKKRKYKRETKKHSLHNPNTILDTGVNHGGNALNNKHNQEDSSVSSFENSLHQCYSGNILLNDFFPYELQCKSTEYLEKTTFLKVKHEVLHDGYYYYIFYSDNDFVQNDIHAIFDIHKPTYQHSNLSDSKTCLNKTYCDFKINFLSSESVIVEVPTKDGLKYIEKDSSILTSVCHPRKSIYIFFPVAVLLLILLFAFL